MPYTEAFKAQMVRRMMGPDAMTATSLAKKVGVPQPTLSKWAKGAVTLAAMVDKTGEQRSGAPARQWTAEEKLRVLVAAHGLDDQALGALLRREGLHAEQLQRWREATAGALAAEGGGTEKRTEGEKRRAAASERRIRELEKELARKEKALAEAAVLLVLEKKLQEMDWDNRHRDEDEKSPEKNEK